MGIHCGERPGATEAHEPVPRRRGTTEDFLRTILKFPENFRLEAILSLGMPAVKPAAYELETLPTDKVHREFFGG